MNNRDYGNGFMDLWIKYRIDRIKGYFYLNKGGF